jgi:hypothetical protein
MAIANAWGLILIILFMGKGLVDVPRSLWKLANVPNCLRMLEFRAPKVKENVVDAEVALYDAAAVIELYCLLRKLGLCISCFSSRTYKLLAPR